jgi:hypothetical protein
MSDNLIEEVEAIFIGEEKVEFIRKGKTIEERPLFGEYNLQKVDYVEQNNEGALIYFRKPIRCESEGQQKITTPDGFLSFNQASRLWCGLDKTLEQMDREMSPSYER